MRMDTPGVAAMNGPSAPISNFASLRGILLAKFEIKGALAKSMPSSAALDLNFLQELAANGLGNSNPPH
jgi:hypothetical protein